MSLNWPICWQIRSLPERPGYDMNASENGTVEIRPSIQVHLGKLPGIDRPVLEAEFSGFQDMFFNEFGIIIPLIEIVEDDQLADNIFQVVINNKKQPPVESLQEGEFCLFVPASQLASDTYFERSWEARPGIEPNSLSEAAILRGEETDRQLWADNGMDTRSRQGYVIFCVAANIRAQPAAFLTPDLLQYYLTRLEDNYPDLIQTASALLGSENLLEKIKVPLE